MKNGIVEIGGLRFGAGLPKVCVPLVSPSEPGLKEEIRACLALPADLLEWRADCFFADPLDALPLVCREAGRRPLLVTLRRKEEGGKACLSVEAYEELLWNLLERGGFSLLDVELSAGEDRVRRLAHKARERRIGLVVSRHDFEKTPGEEEMVSTLVRMKELGADLPKLAVMPQCPGDVLALLSATLKASAQIGPVITMAMGSLGKVSRACGGLTGSCLTFGAGDSASAPGQLNAEDLKAILQDLDPWEGEKGEGNP